MKNVKIFVVCIVIMLLFSSCTSSIDNAKYYSENWNGSNAKKALFDEDDFEDVSVDEMLSIYQTAYG